MAPEETKQAQAPAAPEKTAAPVQEKQTNCLNCNKPIKKLKRYYRDAKFYCSKKCWKQFILKGKEEKK